MYRAAECSKRNEGDGMREEQTGYGTVGKQQLQEPLHILCKEPENS
jgi:hypothetical protein